MMNSHSAVNMTGVVVKTQESTSASPSVTVFMKSTSASPSAINITRNILGQALW